MIINTKNGEVKIFTDNVEQEAISQIIKVGNSSLGENSHIRIMPDCHAGKGCTIGTTMLITDKICPNLIGVDIGCGVNIVKVKENLTNRLPELDEIIRKYIPFGPNVHPCLHEYNFTELKCWDKLADNVKQRSQYSLGSLGGGNHFIEAYTHSISVHSGSRNIGQAVAIYYQKLAERTIGDTNKDNMNVNLTLIPKEQREAWIKKNKIFIEKDLCYLMGENMQDYLHDMRIIQQFAVENRKIMLDIIVKKLKLTEVMEITSTHNFIDTKTMILRKGAISAKEGESLVIPLNMRDGVLICEGKGNQDWNYSAPHGAGRIYSRSRAKALLKLEDYKETMKDVYSTCVSVSTIDESPFAYKDYREIMQNIEPTVNIIERLIPIFNFKSE